MTRADKHVTRRNQIDRSKEGGDGGKAHKAGLNQIESGPSREALLNLVKRARDKAHMQSQDPGTTFNINRANPSHFYLSCAFYS